MRCYIQCDKSTVKLKNKSSVPCLLSHSGEYQSSLLWHKWLKGILMTLVAWMWWSGGKDLSKLGTGRLKRSVIKCWDANVGSILVELQHRLCLNYLNTPVCEKQSRWGARRGGGTKSRHTWQHSSRTVVKLATSKALLDVAAALCKKKKKKREKMTFAVTSPHQLWLMNYWWTSVITCEWRALILMNTLIFNIQRVRTVWGQRGQVLGREKMAPQIQLILLAPWLVLGLVQRLITTTLMFDDVW